MRQSCKWWNEWPHFCLFSFYVCVTSWVLNTHVSLTYLFYFMFDKCLICLWIHVRWIFAHPKKKLRMYFTFKVCLYVPILEMKYVISLIISPVYTIFLARLSQMHVIILRCQPYSIIKCVFTFMCVFTTPSHWVCLLYKIRFTYRVSHQTCVTRCDSLPQLAAIHTTLFRRHHHLLSIVPFFTPQNIVVRWPPHVIPVMELQQQVMPLLRLQNQRSQRMIWNRWKTILLTIIKKKKTAMTTKKLGNSRPPSKPTITITDDEVINKYSDTELSPCQMKC